jgi:hypothetical protein
MTSPRLDTASRNAFQLLLAGKKRRRLAVRVSRISARTDLNGLDAQLDEVVERFLERLVAEEHCEDADFHPTSRSSA